VPCQQLAALAAAQYHRIEVFRVLHMRSVPELVSIPWILEERQGTRIERE
jgi:hypothetical protein